MMEKERKARKGWHTFAGWIAKRSRCADEERKGRKVPKEFGKGERYFNQAWWVQKSKNALAPPWCTGHLQVPH